MCVGGVCGRSVAGVVFSRSRTSLCYPLPLCFALHRVSHALASRAVGFPPTLPVSASWSASSFPGTLVCDRTCRMLTSPGRARCTHRHVWRSLAITSLFRFRFGSHIPVVMLIVYRESDQITSFPFPGARAAARWSA